MHYSPENFENIVSLLPGYVRWKDSNHVYMGCNNLQAKSLGLGSRHEIIGKTDRDLVWRDQAEAFHQVESQVLETGVPITVEEVLPVAGNPRAVFISKKTPLRNEQGNIVGVMGVGIDITNLKQKQEELVALAKQELEAASKAKTEFIHNLEHDIRTPFTGIITVAKYLRANEVDRIKNSHLSDIEQSAEQLLKYFNEVLEISYQASGSTPHIEKQFDIREIFADLFAIHRPVATSKNIKIIQNYTNDCPPAIIADQYRVERILLNLISNAVKFTDKGYVEVRVEVAKQIDIKNIVLQVTVEDSGVGIPAAQLETVFDKFSRISPSYKGLYDGTGMGLYLAKKFIEDINGEIEVQSEKDKGTRVVCLFPVKVPLLQKTDTYNLSELDAI